jgi:hypothetical protein
VEDYTAVGNGNIIKKLPGAPLKIPVGFLRRRVIFLQKLYFSAGGCLGVYSTIHT